MKKYFLTGLIILLPITLTIVIAIWLFDLLTDPFVGIVEQIIVNFEADRGVDLKHHETLVLVLSRLIVACIFCLLVLILGFFGRRFFMRSILRWSQKILEKIPIIKTIYTISHDVTKSLFTEGKTTFKKTVMIPFPKEDTYALGLVTGEPPEAVKKAMGKEVNMSVFIPTSPHPISGYILISSQKELVDVAMSSEEVFRYLISCGLVLPNEAKKEEAPLP